jgi:heme a synthase
MNPAVDFSPTVRLLALTVVLALAPLCWVWLRQRGRSPTARLAALAALTLFLTFDLIVVGAFTRLTDSGLGCPDWPGCYGHASPVGAQTHIAQAEAAMPTGPVTATKAWIEMLHRYLAMVVGVLCLVMAAVSWLERRHLPHSPWWATATLFWVIVQGLFGKYTVTLKLYPAVVTLHLLGALVLLALLVVQRESFMARRLVLPATLRRGAAAVLAIVVVQVMLGGWVSTNYAVLACQGFPACNGQWLPDADFAQGFTLLRALGHTGSGEFLPFDALVAIHLAHRLFAVVAVAGLIALAWSLRAAGGTLRARWAPAVALLTLLQLLSGLSNVVFQWPIASALMHSAGAAALVMCLCLLLARSAVTARSSDRAPAWAGLA